jgi:hypothetical protein
MGKISINQDALKSRREWKRHKIQSGSNVFRILPPFGNVEVHNNYPYRKWSTVWLIDPSTGKRRPFASPMTDGSQDCPVKEYNDKLTKFIDKRKSILESKNVSENQIKEDLKALREVQWQVKVQHTYAYNASDKSGEAGLLEVKSTAHQGLKKMMNEYIKEYGQDPTTLESDINDNAGVWFNITKEGEGKNTEYDVGFSQIRKKSSDGETIKVDDRTALSDNIVENYADLGYDLNAVYTRKTYEELEEILLYNIAVLAQDCPECVLPGYNVEGISAESEETEEVVPVKEEKVTKKSSKVQLRLDSDDSDDEQEVQAPAAKKAPVTKMAPSRSSGGGRMSDADIMAMADDILGE